LQHVNVKIYAAQVDIDLVEAIPVFHRWIQDSAAPELLIDVADYKHVPDGPGVMLIGFEADYSLDLAGGRLGLLYNRKIAGDGDPQKALSQAYGAASRAAKLLESEEAFAGKLRFDYGDVAIILNDRLLAPNTDETWNRLKPEFERFFTPIYGDGSFTLERVGEPRDRFTVSIRRK
jgi:hypothetical protein